jgi:nanoRNase/pAp phosphatase (c-di-AMP/oligoRNAs hydrolase)
MSFRAKNANTHDVSLLAVALGGGGHKAAAGAACDMTLDDAQKKVVENIKELYNL